MNGFQLLIVLAMIGLCWYAWHTEFPKRNDRRADQRDGGFTPPTRDRCRR